MAVPLGRYMAWVFRQRRPGSFERRFLVLVGTDGEEQSWRQYALSLLLFSVVCTAALYLLLRLQGSLPLNPDGFSDVRGLLAVHTAASFVSSTNWQFYAGESTMSNLSQMAGLAVQNFIAPAVGLAAFAAVIRGLTRRSAAGLGNFWVDLYRGLALVFLPLAAAATAVLIAAGVPQTLDGYATAQTVEGETQLIARGPVATQVAIRTLGTNGGGFFNTNGATRSRTQAASRTSCFWCCSCSSRWPASSCSDA